MDRDNDCSNRDHAPRTFIEHLFIRVQSADAAFDEVAELFGIISVKVTVSVSV